MDDLPCLKDGRCLGRRRFKSLCYPREIILAVSKNHLPTQTTAANRNGLIVYSTTFC